MKNLTQLSKAIIFALLLSLAYHAKANSDDLKEPRRLRVTQQIGTRNIAIQYYAPNSKNEKVEIEIQEDIDKWQKIYIKNGNSVTTYCLTSQPNKVVRISTLNKNKEKKIESYTLICGERYGVIWNPQKIIWEIYNLKPKENK